MDIYFTCHNFQPQVNERATLFRITSTNIVKVGFTYHLQGLCRLSTIHTQIGEFLLKKNDPFSFRHLQTSVEFVEMAQGLYHQWSRLLEHEHSQRLKLEEQLEQLARQHSHLEKAAKEAASSGGWNNYTTGSEGDEEEFFDAPEENDRPHDFVLSLPNPSGQQSAPGQSDRHGKTLPRSGSTTSEGLQIIMLKILLSS